MIDPPDETTMILHQLESGEFITGQNMIVDGGLLMR